MCLQINMVRRDIDNENSVLVELWKLFSECPNCPMRYKITLAPPQLPNGSLKKNLKKSFYAHYMPPNVTIVSQNAGITNSSEKQPFAPNWNFPAVPETCTYTGTNTHTHRYTFTSTYAYAFSFSYTYASLETHISQGRY